MPRIKIMMLAHRHLNPGLVVILLVLIGGGLQYMIDGTGQALTIILVLIFWGGLGLDTISRALAQNHPWVDRVGFFKLTTLCLWCMLYGPFAHRIFRK